MIGMARDDDGQCRHDVGCLQRVVDRVEQEAVEGAVRRHDRDARRDEFEVAIGEVEPFDRHEGVDAVAAVLVGDGPAGAAAGYTIAVRGAGIDRCVGAAAPVERVVAAAALQPVVAGRLTAAGRCIRPGRTLSYTEAHVYDASGELLAHGTSTLMALPGRGFDLGVAKFLDS